MNTEEYQTKTNLILPFSGTWMVGNGGRDHTKNSHRKAGGSGPKNQMFAYDFAKNHKEKGKSLEDYEAFGEEVISPADGKITQVIDGCIDVAIGESDRFVSTGNAVIIDHKSGEFSVLAHFQHNSIKVKPNQEVKQGDVLGLCGNTGNTSEPHIHYHLQDNALLHRGIGLPIKFKKILVDGTQLENIELEQGQRVSNV